MIWFERRKLNLNMMENIENLDLEQIVWSDVTERHLQDYSENMWGFLKT